MANPAKWILNGTLVTQNSSRRVLQGNLRIENGRIAEVRTSAPSRFPPGTEIIDAKGLTILPGFVQTHLHLCQTLFRNQADDMELLDWLSKRIWVMEAAHTAETLYASARLGIYELLSSGTTCILDMGTVRHTDSIFRAAQEMGIRANIGKCLMDHPENNPPSLREGTEDALKEALTLHQHWNGSNQDRLRASLAPRFAISCTEKLLREVKQLSEERNMLIHTHASENRKEIELIRQTHHCENIEYFNRLGLTSPRLVLAHGVWLSEREKEILKETGTHIAHCPSSNLKLASGIAPIPDLLARGISVSLGADGAPCNNNLNAFQEMRMAALIHKPGAGPKAMRAIDVLDMATRNGAKALHWFDQIGSIELGKKADLIGVDLASPTNTVPKKHQLHLEAIASALVYATQPQNLRWTMVDGEVLYAKKKVRHVSRTQLMSQVRKAQSQIDEVL